jgi:FMN phosphatase YigB (HAD superfamily)
MTRPVVSYDVFDTVVTRTFAHPRDVFVHLGALLRERGAHQLDALAFARARWAAEHAARRKSSCSEVVLDDIYRELAAQLSWDAVTTGIARDLELEIESRHLRAVPSIRSSLAAARKSAGRLVFLSDMYLPSAVLRPWLAREGVIESDDILLISGEARGNKSSGALFDLARGQIEGNFAQWHHSGDHDWADVGKPRQLGLKATHLTQAHLTGREKKARGSTGEFASVGNSLLAGAMRLARLERNPESKREAVLWETGATVAGPLFYGFVRWTLAEAERRGLRRLYFLARDGQIFWRVAQAIQRVTPGRVECRYLYASRLVFAGPAELSTPEALHWLAAPTGHFHSLRQTLWQLGLVESGLQTELPAAFSSINPDANLSQPEREILADWLLAPKRRAVLHKAMEIRSAQARAYLEANELRAGEPVGLVDAGWLGSIQRNLERILGQEDRPAPLTGFYLGLMPAEPATASGELLGYTNTFAPLPLMREESHKVLIELMAQSDHGQVIGLKSHESGWVPWMNAPGPVNLAEIKLFQEAVLAFTARMLETADVAALPDDELARTAVGLYRDFHDRPTKAEAALFGFLPHADQLYEQRHATLCAEQNLLGTMVALLNFHRRPPHWWVSGQAALGHAVWLRTFQFLKRWRWRLSGRKE